MDSTGEASEIRWRLAEAITWCSHRPPELDPGDSLWTPSLRPAGLSERPPYAEIQASYRRPYGQRGTYLDHMVDLYSYPTSERHRLVDALCVASSDSLLQEQPYPAQAATSLGGRRLVLFALDDSLSDGAAEDATNGFFDVTNLPGWDTWVCYVEDAERIADRQRWITEGMPQSSSPLGCESYLVSWVPAHLLDLVGRGIWVNPEGCIAWAEDLDTAFTRQLRDLALL